MYFCTENKNSSTRTMVFVFFLSLKYRMSLFCEINKEKAFNNLPNF